MEKTEQLFSRNFKSFKPKIKLPIPELKQGIAEGWREKMRPLLLRCEEQIWTQW